MLGWPSSKALATVGASRAGTRRHLGPAGALFGVACLALALALPARGQDLNVEHWNPRSTLVTQRNPVPRAKFPVVDVHSHHRASTAPERVDAIVREMDALNLAVLVNLSGGSGARLREAVKTFKDRHPGRFAVFANPDFAGIGSPGWPERAASQLERDVSAGAQGLKIFKNFGMSVRDLSGRRVPVDSAEMDPLFQVCAKLGIPVLIHVADPAEFWAEHDASNERWLELKLRPRRKRTPPPSFRDLISERDRMLARHPDTKFILAHMGWQGHDLAALSALLDRFENVHVDIAAVLYELGRVPFSGRDFLNKYKRRVLFGKDSYVPSEFPYYWRVLETRDEYFEYYRKYHAHWRLYGLGLPDDTLRHIYWKNAARIIPGLEDGQFD